MGALVEVAAVLALFVLLRTLLRDTNFGAWQESVLGAGFLSNGLFFFVLPLTVLTATRRNLGHYGLTTQRLAYHRGVALKTVSVLLPATLLFPLLVLLETTPREWLGAIILTVGFAAAGLVVIRLVENVRNCPQTRIFLQGLLAYLAMLLGGLAIGYAVESVSDLLTRAVYVLLFVGFLEEFFFRGYVQSRLNDSFGRPYSLFNTHCGLGLVLAAAVFGLLHPIMSPEGTPWPWALWTTVMGLVFGFIREKTGAVVASGIAHGVILLPRVIFAG
jgi:membrane protease YdiL (CAAX protease family)